MASVLQDRAGPTNKITTEGVGQCLVGPGVTVILGYDTSSKLAHDRIYGTFQPRLTFLCPPPNTAPCVQ